MPLLNRVADFFTGGSEREPTEVRPLPDIMKDSTATFECLLLSNSATQAQRDAIKTILDSPSPRDEVDNIKTTATHPLHGLFSVPGFQDELEKHLVIHTIWTAENPENTYQIIFGSAANLAGTKDEQLRAVIDLTPPDPTTGLTFLEQLARQQRIDDALGQEDFRSALSALATATPSEIPHSPDELDKLEEITPFLEKNFGWKWSDPHAPGAHPNKEARIVEVRKGAIGVLAAERELILVARQKRDAHRKYKASGGRDMTAWAEYLTACTMLKPNRWSPYEKAMDTLKGALLRDFINAKEAMGSTPDEIKEDAIRYPRSIMASAIKVYENVEKQTKMEGFPDAKEKNLFTKALDRFSKWHPLVKVAIGAGVAAGIGIGVMAMFPALFAGTAAAAAFKTMGAGGFFAYRFGRAALGGALAAGFQYIGSKIIEHIEGKSRLEIQERKASELEAGLRSLDATLGPEWWKKPEHRAQFMALVDTKAREVLAETNDLARKYGKWKLWTLLLAGLAGGGTGLLIEGAMTGWRWDYGLPPGTADPAAPKPPGGHLVPPGTPEPPGGRGGGGVEKALQHYTVKPGDNLWSIVHNKFGFSNAETHHILSNSVIDTPGGPRKAINVWTIHPGDTIDLSSLKSGGANIDLATNSGMPALDISQTHKVVTGHGVQPSAQLERAFHGGAVIDHFGRTADATRKAAGAAASAASGQEAAALREALRNASSSLGADYFASDPNFSPDAAAAAEALRMAGEAGGSEGAKAGLGAIIEGPSKEALKSIKHYKLEDLMAVLNGKQDINQPLHASLKSALTGHEGQFKNFAGSVKGALANKFVHGTETVADYLHKVNPELLK